MSAMAKFENLKDLIVELRGQSVLLDSDVAELYRVETKRINEAVKNNPDKFVSLFFKKIYYFWWFSPQFGILYPKHLLPFYKILYSGEFLFALIGILFIAVSRDKSLKHKGILLLMVFLSISVFQSLFYVEGRHRLALEPLLLIFTASGIILVLRRSLLRKIDG